MAKVPGILQLVSVKKKRMSACIKIPEWLKNSPSGKQKKSALNCSCVIGSIVGVTNHRGQEFVYMHDRSFPRCGTPA